MSEHIKKSKRYFSFRFAFVFGLLMGALSWRESLADELVADLSEHFVAISTGFAGADLLLFGAIEGDGDIVVVVRGPESRQSILKKSNVAGIWINTSRQVLNKVPSYYSVASSRPLNEITNDIVLARYQIGLDYLRFEWLDEVDELSRKTWREALIRQMQKRDLYAENPNAVIFLGPRLFRTTVTLPANVPTGIYLAEIYLIQDGQVVTAQTTPLSVSKIGFEAEINDLAYNSPHIYGLAAIAIALVLGLAGYVAFRRT